MLLKYNNILVLAIQQHSYDKDSLHNEEKKNLKKKQKQKGNIDRSTL